jgi:hypothetical protein
MEGTGDRRVKITSLAHALPLLLKTILAAFKMAIPKNVKKIDGIIPTIKTFFFIIASNFLLIFKT